MTNIRQEGEEAKNKEIHRIIPSEKEASTEEDNRFEELFEQWAQWGQKYAEQQENAAEEEENKRSSREENE